MTVDEIIGRLDRLRKDGAEFEKILSSAVEMVHASSPRFHWTGIYELFPDGMLRLGPFIGSPTDHVFIAVGKGICGTAVAEKRNLNIPDVSKVPNYLACSTSTRSELVVLIRKNTRIYAQIDIDSHELGAFDDQSVILVESVAACLAEIYAMREDSEMEETAPRGVLLNA